MSHRTEFVSVAAAIALALGAAPALAQHDHGGHSMMKGEHQGHESEAGHSHEMAMLHGGQVTMTPNHHFEMLFTGDQARVYVYDKDQMPITDLSKVHAVMTLVGKDGKTEPMEMKYVAPDPAKGRTQGHFVAMGDMSRMAAGDMNAMMKITGLDKEPVEFRVPVAMGEMVSYACPMNDSPPAEDPGRCPKCGMELTRKGGDHDMEHMHGQSDHH